MESGAQPAGPSRATAERWVQVRALLESALEQETAGRAEFLRRACGSNDELLAETEALLHALDAAPTFLNEPIARAGAAPRDPLVGSAVGPWKLLHHIGTGGTSSVYAAARNDNEFRKVVAVKIIKSGMDVEEILRRFRTERQILASLDHSNITRLLDGGSTPAGLPYLAMEYVEGLPVTRYAEINHLSVSERLALFRTICAAVDYAHRNLVVHRDLKPANILVTALGVPKLLDFGIAKLLRPESAGYTLPFTQTRTRMLTPEYASPEQVRGEPITTASDIYSLGVVLYELLAGQRPYRLETRTLSEIEQLICEREPERPSSAAGRLTAVNCAEGTPAKLARRLRGDLDAIVLTALRKEPQRRYATIDRLSEDIDRHLRGLPVNASRNTWGYRVGKFAARNQAGVAVTASVALILIGATVVSLNLANQLHHQRQAALHLVRFMLGDLDAALRSGSTSARKASLDQILLNLKELSPGSADDPEIREPLFKAYLKVGGVQGNMFESNLGDAAGAKQSYQHAEALARTPAEMAQAAIGLGDCTYSSGDRRTALVHYQKAERVLEQAAQADPREEKTWLELAQVWYKMGLIQRQIGSPPQALESYRHELQIAQKLSVDFSSSLDVRRELALAEEHVSTALERTEDAPGALLHQQRSLEVYRELLKLDPESAVRRLDVAVGLLLVANLTKQLGDLRQAEEHYRNSLELMEGLIAQDPQNEQYQRNRNSILHPFADVLYRRGKVVESRRVTVHALSVLQPLITKPAASSHDLYQYCWDLLTTPFRDLHRPQEALALAQKAVDLTRHNDPGLLNVLALAWEQNRNLEQAIAAERQALALYPASEPVSPGTKHAEIEANLTRMTKRLEPGTTRQK
jgi:serine/threonine protein kinase/tetratricopeptide (TPR) repeat protein